MTKREKYNRKAREIMPFHYTSLYLLEEVDSYYEIDDIIFRSEGEYIGGMTAVIIAILKMEE